MFYDVRQLIFEWCLKCFSLDPSFQQYFKESFTKLYLGVALVEGDLKLSSQECIKIIEFTNYNSEIGLSDPVFSSR
jgi:hypothetical protein